ncbi:MAG: carbamoyl phosphate synthase small subunit [Planctomycetota bacterium]|jgi:carbamoyl-phosphate synthase small subunit
MKAILALEDGTIFEGRGFGAMGEKYGEVVFNTSMAGYQEILTDPSYRGQIVTMTYPLIGNYGVNSEDVESRKPFVEAFVVKECSNLASNWRCEKSLDEYLKENNIIGIEGIDTRALTPGLIGRDLVKDVTFEKIQPWSDKGKYNVVVVDTGTKYNILRELVDRNCKVTVVPAKTSAEQIFDLKPDGIMLSNGPGDPAGVPYVVETVRQLMGKFPIFGICFGHQMLGLALSGETYKLKFGHHGGNHPVKDLKTGKVHITVQNHCFCVDIDSLNKDDIEITHINLNDQTLEGIRHKKLPIFSVQFHPEASPGPHDAKYMFDEFIEMMEQNLA